MGLIDLGNSVDYGSMSGELDGKISYRNRGEHAERKHRQIIKMIWSSDSREELRDIEDDHSEIITALEADYPEYFQEVQNALDEVTILLGGCR